MRINAITKEPQQLINLIDNAIKSEVLKTWGKVLNKKQEALYTHTPDQWNEKVLLKPIIDKENISFEIRWWKKDEPNEETKGYVIGRFIEILLVHFNDNFQFLEIHKK